MGVVVRVSVGCNVFFRLVPPDDTPDDTRPHRAAVPVGACSPNRRGVRANPPINGQTY